MRSDLFTFIYLQILIKKEKKKRKNRYQLFPGVFSNLLIFPLIIEDNWADAFSNVSQCSNTPEVIRLSDFPVHLISNRHQLYIQMCWVIGDIQVDST